MFFPSYLAAVQLSSHSHFFFLLSAAAGGIAKRNAYPGCSLASVRDVVGPIGRRRFSYYSVEKRGRNLSLYRVLCIVFLLIFIFVRRFAMRYREKSKTGDETEYTRCVGINSSVQKFVRRLTKSVHCSLQDTSSLENVHPIHRQRQCFHSWKQCWNLLLNLNRSVTIFRTLSKVPK